MKYLSYLDYRNKSSSSFNHEQFIANHAPFSWFKDNARQAMRPFLTVDEEKELWDKYIASNKKDVSIRNKIVERYMWIAYYTARTLYCQNHMNMTIDDVVSESSLKLIKLVEGFDPSFDNLFITYAVDSIVHYIQCIDKIQYGEFKTSHLLHSRNVQLHALIDANVLSFNDTCDKTMMTYNLAIYFKLKPKETTVKYLVYLMSDVFGDICSLNAPVVNTSGEVSENVTFMDLISTIDTHKPQTTFSQNIETLKRFLIYIRYDVDYKKKIPRKFVKRINWFEDAIENRLFCSIGIERDVNTGLYVYTRKKTFQEIANDNGLSKQAVEQWLHRGLLKNVTEKYSKPLLKEIIKEILCDDMSFDHAKFKLKLLKEKSI